MLANPLARLGASTAGPSASACSASSSTLSTWSEGARVGSRCGSGVDQVWTRGTASTGGGGLRTPTTPALESVPAAPFIIAAMTAPF
eukprot:363424-Chlamydomonas_euryale.AAC.2